MQTKERLLIDFAKHLYQHLKFEEKNLYIPLLEKSAEWEKMIECFNEHSAIEKDLEKILLTTNPERWLIAFSEFSKTVLTHIKNEETIIFKLAKHTLSPSELKS